MSQIRFISKTPFYREQVNKKEDPYSQQDRGEIIKYFSELEAKEKAAFKNIIIEKLKNTVIASDVLDLVCDILPQPPKGYPRWHLLSDHLPGIIPKLICHLCGQFAKRPIRCSKCSWVYCKDCHSYLNQLPSFVRLQKPSNLRQFFCLNECIDFCHGEYPTMTHISEDLHQEYHKILFHCRHIFCKFFGRPDTVFSHETECVAGPIDWSFDTTMMANNYGGEFYNKYCEEHPLQVEDILIPARRRAEFIKGQNDFYREDLLRIWVMTHYPNQSRIWYSNKLNVHFGWRDAVRQYKYHDGILSDLEQYAQSWGLPFYQPTEQMKKMNIKPLPDPDTIIEIPAPKSTNVTQRENKITDTNFKRPAPIYTTRQPPSKRVSFIPDNSSWSVDTPLSGSSSPCSSIGSDCSNATRLSNVSDYLDSDVSRAFVMKKIWESFDETKREQFITQKAMFPTHRDNRTLIPQVRNPNKTEEERRAQIIKDNQRAYYAFSRRPTCRSYVLPTSISKVVKESREEAKKENKVIISFSLEWATTKQHGILCTSPIWVIITDIDNVVIYESLIRQTGIHHMCTERHGVQEHLLRRQRSFDTVRSQVINYLVAADIIIGAGIQSHLRWLGLTQIEIQMLRSKIRDMTIFWSPRPSSSCNLALNAMLVFKKRIIEMHQCHPFTMATAATNLYLFGRKEIEEAATRNNGITTDRLAHLVNNKTAHDNLMEYLQLIESGHLRWPNNWCRPPYEFRYKFPGAYQQRTFENVLPYDPEDDEDFDFTPSMQRTSIQLAQEEN